MTEPPAKQAQAASRWSAPTQEALIAAPSRKHTQHLVTKWLLGILTGTIILHYLSMWAAVVFIDNGPCRAEVLSFLSSLFQAALPAEVGLVGAATAFYFKSD